MHIEINGRKIGKEYPTFVVAEMSANHKQDFDQAVKIIKAAKDSGADAIKFQTYTPDTITIDCRNDFFKIKGTIWDGRYLYELYKEAYTPWEWQPKLKQIACDLGLVCFSSPFDKSAVDFLEEINIPAYKVASYEITDIPLIQYIASKNKPIFFSTGIATLQDIQNAVDVCREIGNDQITLLKCTSSYPAPIEEANLRTIPDLAERFNVVSGLSDHTLGITVPITSVALGAKVIEKHLILDKSVGGPDAAFSLDRTEFKAMVGAIRDAEKALGVVNYELNKESIQNRSFSRSLFVVEDIKSGESFNEANIRSIRPGYGLEPKFLYRILGKKAKRDLEKGTPLDWDFCE